MSTIFTEDSYDYSALTSSYMGIFYSQKFEQFLKTTQTGYAHSTSGIEFSFLFKTVFTSLCLCTIQLTFFCFFRSIFKYIYQPRCYCVPVKERMEPLPRGFLSWIAPIMQTSIYFYLSMGLDAYFFIRFISILLLYFIFIGSMNMIVLIPINYTGSDASYSAVGLDRLSLSNIASSNVRRLNAHFILGLVTIALFHWMLLYELQSFVAIRQSYLLSARHKDSIQARVLLISNVPTHLQDIEVLNEIFGVIPGGIRTIWFLYEFDKIECDVERAKKALEVLEISQIKYLNNYIKRNIRRSCFSCFSSDNDKLDDLIEELHVSRFEFQESSEPMFYPPIYVESIRIPKLERRIQITLPGLLRILIFQRKVSMVKWAVEALATKLEEIDAQKRQLVEGKALMYKKVFIEFNTQTGAYIAHQCLLSQNQGSVDSSLIEVNPQDILWHNLSRNNSYACLVEKYVVTIVFISIMILYVVPVSFIGLVSQIPLLVHLMPFLSWIYRFPEEARETISSFLPSILLTILTEIVMVTFRFLTYFKGKLTGSELEIDFSKWYFAFLFVQQFLVVTISSSITVIFKQIVDQPTSIPVLLATNLPKAATFFFQFFALKAFAFCGANFMRIDQLILHHSLYPLKDVTPRQKFRRLTTLPKIKWGTVYPVYSVYACIGIAYSIISPLISLFIIFILSLVLLYYKYSLKFIYSHINVSETQGRLYPLALLHLYTGVYCLECCIIGIFFLSKSEDGNSPMRLQGWFMVVVLLTTIFGHITIYNRYSKHFSYLPILTDKKFKDESIVQEHKSKMGQSKVTQSPEEGKDNENYSQHQLLYVHPAFQFENPKVWLPVDPLGIAERQILRIEEMMPGLQGGVTKGATVTFGKSYRQIKVRISEAPPDYK
ncbi:uncharacterized protein RJT20DRAFT_97774 [Scheffersomyces xylosifermentans]|uniref:uncharacterized protein n=1 Tax=Scheffersomyces xylosifermentans TaxID=1304137 RepID=UPI00315D37AD